MSMYSMFIHMFFHARLKRPDCCACRCAVIHVAVMSARPARLERHPAVDAGPAERAPRHESARRAPATARADSGLRRGEETSDMEIW